jgi:hypothetical protein
LIDQSDLPVEQTRGGPKAQVAQLLMMAAFQKSTAGPAACSTVAGTGRANWAGRITWSFWIVDLAATQERRLVQEFVENLQQYTVDIGGETLT